MPILSYLQGTLATFNTVYEPAGRRIRDRHGASPTRAALSLVDARVRLRRFRSQRGRDPWFLVVQLRLRDHAQRIRRLQRPRPDDRAAWYLPGSLAVALHGAAAVAGGGVRPRR